MAAKGLSRPTFAPDSPQTRFLFALHEAIATLTGNIGAMEDRALTVRDLMGLGLVGLENGRIYNPNKAAAPGFGSGQAVNYVDLFDVSGNPVSTVTGEYVQIAVG